MTEVEAIIASHALKLSRGEGLYWNLDEYPFTVSPYGPVLYALEAAGVMAGFAPMATGRLASFASLVTVLCLIFRILMHSTADKRCAWAGTLLAGGTANLVAWGVTAQSDMPALVFSMAGFERFLRWENDRRLGVLIQCGACIALAVFTKQSSIAAGATICLLLAAEDRRIGLKFSGILAACGAGTAMVLNWCAGGHYFDNAVLANLNPLSWTKLVGQVQYLVHAGGALIVLAAVGMGKGFQASGRPIYLYAASAGMVFLATAPKVGSDLNYQIELAATLSLCAGWSLWRFAFFDKWAANDKGLIPLLQLPLALHLTLNWAVDVRQASERYVRELERREQFAQLQPWIATDGGRILSVEADPLLHARGGAIEVEPLIYTLLVEAGLANPEPVRRDLSNQEFSSVLLYQDLSKKGGGEIGPGTPRLPSEQLDIVRERYELKAHIPGPLAGGLYVYEPKRRRRSGFAPDLPMKHE